MASSLNKAYMHSHLLKIKFKIDNSTEATDLLASVKDAERIITYNCTAIDGGAKVVHTFKVVGEPLILAVLQVTFENLNILEKVFFELSKAGISDVICEPLIPYESFAQRLEVDENLTVPSTNHIVNNSWLYWMEFNVEYAGKSTEDLLSTWKREAVAALAARVIGGVELDLFKVVAERKVQVFIGVACPEDVDKLSFDLPLMKENGANVQIFCKSIQLLQKYLSLKL